MYYNREQIPVDNQFIADLKWFRKFLRAYNGRSMIPHACPNKHIVADSCLSAGGATDFDRCYTLVYPKRVADSYHITILEALNCLVALRLLLTDADNNTTVSLACDNQSTVFSLTSGRARDPVLSAIARAVWFIEAKRNITLIVTHVPGQRMQLADALSRAHISHNDKSVADKYVQDYDLKRVNPPLYLLDFKPYT